MSQEMTIKKHSMFTTKEIVFTAFMAVIIAVCSWISIPAQVPFTLQTFAVFCALGLLGGKNGFFAVLVYILLGICGVPVFAGFTGGIGIIMGSTGGYIVGFLLLAVVYLLAEKIPVKSGIARFIVNVSAMIIGLGVCYAFGTAWFMYVYAKSAEIDLATALKWCVTPFIPIDLAKMALAIVITERVKKYVNI